MASISKLAIKIWNHKATPADVAEYKRLRRIEKAVQKGRPLRNCGSIWDLPVAEALFRADARDMGW